MAGSVLGSFLVTLYLAVATAHLRAQVQHPALAIALRVAAAWIAAIAMLMLALSVADPVA
jgi:uncharacterized membrane protein